MNDESQIQSSGNRNQSLLSGGIAQLVERLPCTQEVSGSSPLTSTLTSLGLKGLVN